jgi:hypothetical protein
MIPVPEGYLKLGSDHFLPRPLQFSVHRKSLIGCCVIRVGDDVLKDDVLKDALNTHTTDKVNNRTLKKETPWPLVRERRIPTERLPWPAKLDPTLWLEIIAWSSQRIRTAVNPGSLDQSR